MELDDDDNNNNNNNNTHIKKEGKNDPVTGPVWPRGWVNV